MDTSATNPMTAPRSTPGSTLRYALIGAGMMGQEHLRNLALLRDHGGVDISVTAIVDPDATMRDSAECLAHALGFTDVAALSHHRDLPLSGIDALVLVTPNHTHAALLTELLPHGKAILAEKPLCTTVPDCEAILTLLEMHNVPFWVAMEYRYMPPTARFLERLREGCVGRLQMLSIREHRYPFLTKVDDWNRFSENTGGTLVEKCCHHFDLMRQVTGAEPVRIFASGGMDVNHLDERYDGRTPDILDNALVIVDFDSGVRASLELCMFADGAEPQEQLTAIGDRGKLDAFIPGPARFWPGRVLPQPRVVFSPRDQSPPDDETVGIDPTLAAAGDHHGSTFYQHQQFARAVLQGKTVAVTAADGAMAVRMGAAAQESIRSGQAIDLRQFQPTAVTGNPT